MPPGSAQHWPALSLRRLLQVHSSAITDRLGSPARQVNADHQAARIRLAQQLAPADRVAHPLRPGHFSPYSRNSAKPRPVVLGADAGGPHYRVTRHVRLPSPRPPQTPLATLVEHRSARGKIAGEWPIRQLPQYAIGMSLWESHQPQSEPNLRTKSFRLSKPGASTPSNSRTVCAYRPQPATITPHQAAKN